MTIIAYCIQKAPADPKPLVPFSKPGAVCTDPGRPPDGSQIAVSYEAGAVVTFTCDRPGYTAIPAEVSCIPGGDGAVWNDTTTPACWGESLTQVIYIDPVAACSTKGELGF